jgi:hypothetical protein
MIELWPNAGCRCISGVALVDARDRNDRRNIADKRIVDVDLSTIPAFRRCHCAPHVQQGGLFADGVMFGTVSGGQIYFKADATTTTYFEREQCGPFEYSTKTARGC